MVNYYLLKFHEKESCMCETHKLCFVQEELSWQEIKDNCSNCDYYIKNNNFYASSCYLENNVSRLCKEAHKIDRLIQAGESDFFIRFYLFKFRMLISWYRLQYFVQSIFYGYEPPQLELIRQWASVEKDRREKISSRTEMLNPLICPHSHKFVFARICSRML